MWIPNRVVRPFQYNSSEALSLVSEGSTVALFRFRLAVTRRDMVHLERWKQTEKFHWYSSTSHGSSICFMFQSSVIAFLRASRRKQERHTQKGKKRKTQTPHDQQRQGRFGPCVTCLVYETRLVLSWRFETQDEERGKLFLGWVSQESKHPITWAMSTYHSHNFEETKQNVHFALNFVEHSLWPFLCTQLTSFANQEKQT